MKRFISLIFTLLIVSASVRSQTISHVCKKSDLNNIHFKSQINDNYNVTYYRLNLELNPAVRYIKGEVKTVFYFFQNSGSIEFELSDSLNVDSILYQNNQVSFTRISPGILHIDFGVTLNPGYDSVKVYYQGIPPLGSGFGSFNTSVHGPANVPVLWTLSEPYGASDWWPCKNTLNDKADSVDILVTHPNSYKCASNGLRQSIQNTGNNHRTHWKHRYPIATYLIAVALADYTELNSTISLNSGPLPFQNFVYTEDLADAQTGLNQFVPVLTYFDSLYTNYPFLNEKYGHAQFGWGGGMEHQTMTFVINYGYELLTHEMGHQWFGDKVTCGSWEELWLNEGFATYTVGLAYERFSPNYYWKYWKQDQINFVCSSPDGSVFVTDTSNVSRLFDGRLTYSKGAYVIHMLRWVCGDDAFFSALHDYLNTPPSTYAFGRNSRLKDLLEFYSGLNLDTFFNNWFMGEGYPTYTLTYTQDVNNLLHINLSQITSNASVSFYEMPVPVLVKNGSNDTLIVLNHQFNNQNFTVNPGFAADSIIFDPDRWILSSGNIVTGQFKPKSEEFKIITNPGSNIIRILGNINQEIYTICNSSGQVVEKGYLTKGENSVIEIDNLPAGLYFIHFFSDLNNFTSKFVISK